MYVCICNAITDTEIRDAVDNNGVRNLKQLSRINGCGLTCGSCQDFAADVIQEAVAKKREQAFGLPVLQMA